MGSLQLRRAAAAAVLALSLTWAAGAAEWVGTHNSLWTDPTRWNPAAVPTASTDVLFGSAIDANDTIRVVGGSTPVTINARTLTIATANPFRFTGEISSFGEVYCTLVLATGDLTRQNVAGTEQDQVMNMIFQLNADGVWDVQGSNTLTLIGGIRQGGGVRNFTKVGAGALRFQEVQNHPMSNLTGLTTVSEGRLEIERGFFGTGVYRVLDGAVLDLYTVGTHANPIQLNGHGTGIPITGFSGALRVSEGTNNLLEGSVTLQSDSAINVLAGAKLTLTGAVGDGAATSQLTKMGPGELVMTAAGNYGGGTYISAGRLTVTHASALGLGGAVTVASNGSLALSGGISVSRPVVALGMGAGGAGAVLNLVGDNTLSSVQLQGNSAIDVAAATTLTVGQLSESGGSFGLTKLGPGTLRLNQPGGMGGDLTITSGVVRASQAFAASGQAVVQDGAALELAGDAANARALRLSGSGIAGAGALLGVSGSGGWSGPVTLSANSTVGLAQGARLTISGPVTGAFVLSKSGAGELVLSNGANAFSELNASQGVLTVAASGAAPPAAVAKVSDGASVQLNAGTSSTSPLQLTGGGVGQGVGALHAQGAGTGTWAGTIMLSGQTTTSAHPASSLALTGPVTGAFRLTHAGPGELVLGAGNSHAGTTAAGGVVTLTAAAAIPAGTMTDILDGATLQLRNAISTAPASPAKLSGFGSAGQGALFNADGSGVWGGPVLLAGDAAVGAAAGTTLTLPNTISDDPAAPASRLVKVGQGTLILSAANTHRGGTSVNGGTLSISSDASLGAPAGPVTLNNGGRLLATASMGTSRVLNLNTGSLQAAAPATVTYGGAVINGGFLRGPGTHALDDGTTLAGTTALPGSRLTTSGAVSAANLTNSGALTVPAGSTLHWDGGYHTPAGNLAVLGTLNVSDFENTGNIVIGSAGVLSAQTSPLVSGGGVITVEPGGALRLGGGQADLYNTLAVNNGAITNGKVNVRFGAMLAGTGAFPEVTLHPGGLFLPGTSLANAPEGGPLSTGAIAPLDPDQTVDAAIQLAGDTSATVNADHHSLTLTGLISGPGKVLTKSGPGVLIVGGIRVGTLALSEGTVRVAPQSGAAALSILDHLTIAGAPGASTATLDLASNHLIVRNGDIATITSQVRSGRAGGAWNGPGLTSSAAAADPTGITSLAAVLNDAGDGRPLLETFAGEPVDSKAVLVMYTYTGDADLSGAVDADDLARTDRGFLSRQDAAPDNDLGGWQAGDFNYDNRVDVSDYFLIDRAMAMQGQPLGQGGPVLPAAAATAVPEPGTAVTLLSLTGTLGARRHRPRCKNVASILLI